MTSSNNLVRISADPISQEEVTQFVIDPSAGGISIFLGVTRDNFKGKKVVQLEYEAYTSMATKQLSDICTAIRGKWPVTKIAIVHRTGIVPVCEPSVIIAVSSVHRKEAIEATSYAIDAVKSSVTVWKKEVYAEGEGEWKENKECRWT
ncbi:molybdopterin synthase catalytic subunit-like [Halichondria panicea]|uniref:molybdopterin synthase catalytic subunit-like n=1 Tax=Halichondria panicea TaxID=6063 RepID=UPI00312B6FD5